VPIKILKPSDWDLTPPVERGRHAGMTIHAEDPFVRVLEAEPDSYMASHSHNEPEIMVVLEGRLMFNGQWCGQGTIVHVPADEDYWFTTGAEHCVVAIMRPKDRGEHHRAAQADAAVDQTS